MSDPTVFIGVWIVVLLAALLFFVIAITKEKWL